MIPITTSAVITNGKDSNPVTPNTIGVATKGKAATAKILTVLSCPD
jgi:hypothetical protein